MKTKILILSCSTGEGHNSAANALKTALEERDVLCEIADPVAFQSDKMKNVVSSLYNNMIKRTPAVFGVVYKLGDMYSSSKLPSPIYWANSQYAEKLKKYILDNECTAVICTHLYGMEAMTAIKQDKDFDIPCYAVLTDYTSIPFIDETKLDGYFVTHNEIKATLHSRGIPVKNIYVTGIPVNSKFTEHIDKTVARERLNIPQEKKVFLIMTGGIGCENMLGLCDDLIRNLESDGVAYILVGRNEDLKKDLDRKYYNNTKLKTVSFTKEVVQYMVAADVMISKAGGLSSTEAAVVNVPLVHVNAIPGCETCNAKFFARKGMSIYAHSDMEAVKFANYIAYNKEKADKMRAMQRKYVNPNAAKIIIEKVMAL